jgi:uncharacterized protein (DUF362 family)
MKKISRRKFLRASAAGLSVAALDSFLTACGQGVSTPATLTPLPVPSATTAPPQPTTAPAPTATTAQAEPPAAFPTAALAAATATIAPKGVPDLVVAKGGEPEDLVRRAIAALGGMEQFVPKGARVVVKPNICTSYHTYEYATTTNPMVVATLVKMCLEAGAGRVQVFDYPFGGALMDAYQISGISDAVKEAGGEMTPMAGYQYVEVEIPNALSLKKTKAYKDVLEADVLINVPIAKHHSSTRLTIGMKNLMGIIQNRNAIHADLWHRIPDLARLFKPALTVVDAVRILTAHGPSGGSLDDVKKLDTIIASRDIVAVDTYATSLFDIKPEDIPYIPIAAESGLGNMNLSALSIEELPGG